ncbi:MAG: hypothetical protein IIC76_07650 [Bacteroidetes bacterium]|nr:hypothetical protein [Bacteroidota bacterium]
MTKLKFKKNIVFINNRSEYFLFQVMNIGKNLDEIKFNFNDPKFSTAIIHLNETNTFDDSTLINKYGEATYHSDGTFMYKFPNYPIKEMRYNNPHGAGAKRMPLSNIKGWEPLFKFDIYDYNLCRKIKEIKDDEKIILINDHLFNGKSFSCLINFSHINYPVPILSDFSQLSTTVNSVTDNLNLWIVIISLNDKGYFIKMEPMGQKIFSQNNHLQIIEKK